MSVATMPTVDELALLVDRLACPDRDLTDAERIDLISGLESLKGAAAAAQARLSVDFDASQRAEQARRGMPADKQGKGVAHQIALARHESPQRGTTLLGLAHALVREMPHTLHALTTGGINEWRATLMVRETAALSAEHRAQVDAELADRLASLGNQGVEREARKIAYRIDPGSVARRSSKAHSERRVSIRPAPDTMSYVTGFLPVAQGVAVHAALTRHADSLRSGGDERSRGQIMADTLVERVTGQERADAVPVEIQLVMTDSTLLGGDQEPATVIGYGPVPAALGRSLVAVDATDMTKDDADEAEVWLRRLYTSPTTGDLVAIDSKRRCFPAGVRRLTVVRDEVCRTPWCDAPIRHIDHVVGVAEGGPTSFDNAQGLCEACNQAKEAPGWTAEATRAGPGAPVTVTTPTGHTYTSRAPDPPGGRPPLARLRLLPSGASALEQHFGDLLASA